VTDQALLGRILNEREIISVIHLAAQTTVPVAQRSPASTFSTNVGGTWALLEACRRAPTVGQIVVASSDKAYGSAGRETYKEDTPLGATDPYDVSKACADMIARSYAGAFGLAVGVTRCGNFFGGGDLNWNRIVPGTIRSVIRGQRPMVRSDGTPVRDYVFVEDGAEATLLLAERLAGDPSLAGQAFNFSAERPLTVLELVGEILAIMGSDLEPVILGKAGGEIPYQALCAEKARDRLGWRPVISLREGLERTVDWYSKFFGEGKRI
jgi:CDP-glucose 4,6-dehydratase